MAEALCGQRAQNRGYWEDSSVRTKDQAYAAPYEHEPERWEDKPTLTIRPHRRWFEVDFVEIWHNRDLFYFLVRRDILLRYKQTVLGAGWAILQPLATMVLFTTVFGLLGGFPSEGLPYPLFSYSGLVLWTFFANACTTAANSLVGNPDLVTKIYFPRLLMPAAPVVVALLDFGIAFSLLVLLMPYYGIYPSTNLWALPVFVALAALAALGVGILLCALNVKYRDFRYIIAFVFQFWMFASPVLYSASLVGEKWRLLLAMNPMVGAIEGFRWALFGTSITPWPMAAVGAGVCIAIFVVGVLYFQRTEEFFADLI